MRRATLLITLCTGSQHTCLCHITLSMLHLKGWDMLHSWSLPEQEVSVPICAMYPSNPCLMGWDMLHSWSLPVQEVSEPVYATLEGVRSATLLITSCTGSSIHLKLHPWSLCIQEVSVLIYAMLKGVGYAKLLIVYRKSGYLSMPHVEEWDKLHSALRRGFTTILAVFFLL